MTIEIANSIQIGAPVSDVLELARRVEDWPRILSHYRYVELLAYRPEGRIVEMSALRRPVPIPVRWRAIQRVADDGSRILYRHIGGVTRGMEVEWSIVARASAVNVTIIHRFAPRWPWPGPWIARHIVCGFFVHAIADRTLAGIKLAAESGHVLAAEVLDVRGGRSKQGARE